MTPILHAFFLATLPSMCSSGPPLAKRPLRHLISAMISDQSEASATASTSARAWPKGGMRGMRGRRGRRGRRGMRGVHGTGCTCCAARLQQQRHHALPAAFRRFVQHRHAVGLKKLGGLSQIPLGFPQKRASEIARC